MDGSLPAKPGGLGFGDWDLARLKIVVLNNPSASWHDAEVRDLFGKIVQLKLCGYRAEYPSGALPLDTTDFIGAHVAIVEQNEDGLSPLLAYKVVSGEQAGRHGLDFPALTTMRSANAESQALVLQELLEDCRRSDRRVGYGSGWTIRPDLRRRRKVVRLKHLVIAAHLHTLEGMKLDETFAFGVPRLKTELMQASLGYERVTGADGAPLPLFGQRSLQGEPVGLMRLVRHSDYARAYAALYEPLWSRRLVFGSDLDES